MPAPTPLMIVSLITVLFLALNTILPASAAVDGEFRTKFGHICKWRETDVKISGKRSPNLRRIRLKCTCIDKHAKTEEEDKLNVEYQCYYLSDTYQCCTKQKGRDSWNHYHKYARAYYGQAVDQMKGKLIQE